jgi:threonine/homoserine/homoserine lactone efflux protein
MQGCVGTMVGGRSEEQAGAPPVGMRRAFREGVPVEALNPETATFFLAFVPQLVNPAAGGAALRFALPGVVSVVPNTLADIVVAYAAGSVRLGVAECPGLVRRLREASGAAMVALGLGLLFADRPAAVPDAYLPIVSTVKVSGKKVLA